MKSRRSIDFSYSILVHYFFFDKIYKNVDFIVLINFYYRNFIFRIHFTRNTQFEIDRLISLITELASSS